MKYFDSGAKIKGGCYHEFVKGKWDGKTHWSDDSIVLDDDILNDLNLYRLFSPVVPTYDPYGPTEFSWPQWTAIRSRAIETGCETALLIRELDTWLGAPSGSGVALTILGV